MEINGVFEGGGVRGIALAGAAAATLDRGYRFHRAVGTSAGALVAALVVAGYNGQELEGEVAGLNWRRLLHPTPLASLPLLGKHLALMTHKGVNSTDRIEAVWSQLLLRKGIRTFGDLPEGALQVVATDITHGSGVAFPHCLPGYGVDPDTFPVARATVMSAAVPFLFAPVPLRDTLTGEKVLFSDGAMAANYPIGVVAKDRPVFGYRLSPDANSHVHHSIRGPYGLAKAVIVSGIRARYSLPRTIEGADRVITVPVRDDLDFDVTRRQASAAFTRAYAAVHDQLAPVTSA
ncbi:MAG: patatin-like phospholipase family protein [Acidimicrobiia bacterium]